MRTSFSNLNSCGNSYEANDLKRDWRNGLTYEDLSFALSEKLNRDWGLMRSQEQRIHVFLGTENLVVEEVKRH